MSTVRNKTSASLPFTLEGRSSDAELAPAATRGSLTVQAIFKEHGPFVLRVVRRLGVAPRDVEDVAQEVFVIVHRKLHTFNGESSVRTWLFGIASRVSSDHRRRAHVRRESLDVEAPLQISEPAQAQAVHDRQLRQTLDRALDELDEVKRAVFVLYEMEGVPMQEIAESQGCPLPTAYSRLREARERVRAHFSRAYTSGGEI